MASSILAVAVATVMAEDQNGAGTVEGRILFDAGAAPKGVSAIDTVIYLVNEKAAATKTAASNSLAKPILDQRDIAFVPHVLPVMAGATVEIRNSDAILHNVHTTSLENRAFNRAQLGNKSMEVVFEAPEIIRVGCDVHSQMQAYIVVVPTPFFTKAARDGSFSLPAVPNGKYQLIGWNPKYPKVISTIEILAGQVVRTDMNFTRNSQAQALQKASSV